MNPSLVFKYFQELTELQKQQFSELGSLYAEWNDKINVISRKDIDLLYERHVLHSLAIAKVIDFDLETKVLDVGTGGGFPGIPLAIVFPQVRFHLIDSIGKKIKVCQEIATSLGLMNVTAEHGRMEKVKGNFDFIVSRAVAPTKQLIQWTHTCLNSDPNSGKDGGWVFLKGGDLRQELMEVKRPYQEIKISEHFSEPFFETKKVIRIGN